MATDIINYVSFGSHSFSGLGAHKTFILSQWQKKEVYDKDVFWLFYYKKKPTQMGNFVQSGLNTLL